ncbi:MAG: oligosaccharyl transferase, archaeosortase A system-associated [Dehalococcoidia bacterium]
MSEQSPRPGFKLPPEAIAGIVLAALFGLALYIRIALPYDQVFVKDWVWFRDTDAYYYIRHIENLVRNFPHFNSFDPYMLYPGGSIGLHRPFFAWLIAGIVRLVTSGVPSLQTIETVGAYMPAVLGALTLIPAYFIGRELFNRWAGLLAAALIAILPGEFLHRSLLGFTDHHVAEVLFSTTSMLFFIMAIKRARERDITFRHLLARDWSALSRPLVYALLAGLFLGFYLLTWVGGLMFIFIIFACLLVQFIVDHLRRRSPDYLCIVGTPLFLLAFIMLLPVLGQGGRESVYRLAMSIAILAPIALALISRLMQGRRLRPLYYPLTLLVLAGISLAVLYGISPGLFRSMRGLFSIFSPAGASLTIMEAQPILFPGGNFSFQIAWANFTTSFFISFIALFMLAFATVREKSAHKTVFLIWSIVMLMAVLGQRRFGYYFAVNAALLTGYFTWKMLDLAGLNRLLTRPGEAVAAVREFKKRKKKAREKASKGTFMQPRGTWLLVIVVGIALFFLVFFPNIPNTRRLAGQPNFVIHGEWYESLDWLRENSPEPFGGPDYYYELYPSRGDFEYPETAYGVMSWWDYGYFITQIGHRLPNANPTQSGAPRAGRYFTSLNETSASEQLDELGTRYVVIDYTMPTGKFYAMVEWAGLNRSDYFDVYYQRTEDGNLSPITLYHEHYYRSMVARLYNFDGQAVVPEESIVISYQGKTAPGGVPYKEITSAQFFDTYEEAAAYLADQTGDNYIIVSPDPFKSPVPLEALQSYQLIYQTEGTRPVKVFEYLGP